MNSRVAASSGAPGERNTSCTMAGAGAVALLGPATFFLELLLLLAGCAFAAELRRCRANGDFRVWHAHHLLGDAVGLVLERIIGAADPRACAA